MLHVIRVRHRYTRGENAPTSLQRVSAWSCPVLRRLSATHWLPICGKCCWEIVASTDLFVVGQPAAAAVATTDASTVRPIKVSVLGGRSALELLQRDAHVEQT